MEGSGYAEDRHLCLFSLLYSVVGGAGGRGWGWGKEKALFIEKRPVHMEWATQNYVGPGGCENFFQDGYI